MSTNTSEIKPSQAALNLAAALKRGRERQGNQKIATLDEICKVLGAVRTDLGPDKEPPSVKLIIGWNDEKRVPVPQPKE